MTAASHALQASAATRGRIKRSWSIVSDDRQGGWFDPDMGVRCDQTGVLENEEPMSMHRAEELLERLENPEVDE